MGEGASARVCLRAQLCRLRVPKAWVRTSFRRARVTSAFSLVTATRRLLLVGLAPAVRLASPLDAVADSRAEPAAAAVCSADDSLWRVVARVSVASDGSQSDGDSSVFATVAAISADGRFIAFTSDATNLVPVIRRQRSAECSFSTATVKDFSARLWAR